jgi:hypothetical protein
MKDIISKARASLNSASSLTLKEFIYCINELKDLLDKKYDYSSLLNSSGHYKSPEEPFPTTLAEALLWKIGKWETFLNFVGYYNGNQHDSHTDVVFYAFARHLAEEKLPIFDQHSLRAIWAICEINDDEEKVLKKSLFKKVRNKQSYVWRSYGTGKEFRKCYSEIFLPKIYSLLPPDFGRNEMTCLDAFLMPLGQMIKNKTEYYNCFKKLISNSDAF